MARVLKANDEMKKRAFLALTGTHIPDVDLLPMMTLTNDLKRASRVLDDAIETGEIIRNSDGFCWIGEPGLELAGLYEIIEKDLHHFGEQEEEENDD